MRTPMRTPMRPDQATIFVAQLCCRRGIRYSEKHYRTISH